MGNGFCFLALVSLFPSHVIFSVPAQVCDLVPAVGPTLGTREAEVEGSVTPWAHAAVGHVQSPHSGARALAPRPVLRLPQGHPRGCLLFPSSHWIMRSLHSQEGK